MAKKKVLTVIGTRPEIVKMSQLIPKLDKAFNHILVHTGQHYSFTMDKIFFKELNLRLPDHNLAIGSSQPGNQTAAIITGIEKLILRYKPDFALVQGDTNSAVAAAIAASKQGVPLGHVEAGCRCFDRKRPEEVNRIIIDHCSGILFAPNKDCSNNLSNEGIQSSKISIVGNTLIEAVSRNYKFARNSNILKKLGLKEGNYLVFTFHRAEHVDNPKIIRHIINAVNRLSSEISIVFPAHPRTLKMMKKHKLKLAKEVILLKPLGYLDFLKLLGNALFVLTDSGGIQEEAIILNTPCLILMKSTEWVDFVRKGKNILAGIDEKSILKNSMPLIRNRKKVAILRAKKCRLLKNASAKIIFKIQHFLKG